MREVKSLLIRVMIASEDILKWNDMHAMGRVGWAKFKGGLC